MWLVPTHPPQPLTHPPARPLPGVATLPTLNLCFSLWCNCSWSCRPAMTRWCRSCVGWRWSERLCCSRWTSCRTLWRGWRSCWLRPKEKLDRLVPYVKLNKIQKLFLVKYVYKIIISSSDISFSLNFQSYLICISLATKCKWYYLMYVYILVSSY